MSKVPEVRRLKRLELTNFRGFETLSLDFEPDLTLLVGPNGAGKTTVLDAIVCVAAKDRPLVAPTDVKHGASRAELGLTSGTNGDEDTARVSIRSMVNEASEISNGQHPVPTLFVYHANRQVRDHTSAEAPGPRARMPQSWIQRKAKESWWNASASYQDFFQWFKDTEDLENEQIRYENVAKNEQLESVRQAIMALLPEIKEIRVRRQMLRFSMTPVLMLRKGDIELPFDALSEGERTTVAMVGDIARRLALLGEHEDPLQTAATVIIDEIEQHAHPGWQRQMLKRLRGTFPNVQLITTTHSPIIISEAEPRQLRVLKDFALVPTQHGPGRDANAVLEDVFGVAPRNEEVQDRLDALAEAIEDDRFDDADQLLQELDALIPGGADPDIVYYRNILARLRSP